MKIILELLFPGRCPVCDRVQPLGEIVCPQCADSLERMRIQSPFCRKCGKPLADSRDEFCGDCTAGGHRFLEGRALYPYPAVRKSIYRYKYQGRKEYAGFYAREMARHLGDTVRRWHPDALVPVPLHRTRQAVRGYNQAAALAEALGRELGIPVENRLIRRVRKTVPQKLLRRQMRQNNLKRAFKISKNVVKLNTIIIIDDIYTTGSTVDAVTAVLQEAGIRQVYFITLAIGKG